MSGTGPTAAAGAAHDNDDDDDDDDNNDDGALVSFNVQTVAFSQPLVLRAIARRCQDIATVKALSCVSARAALVRLPYVDTVHTEPADAPNKLWMGDAIATSVDRGTVLCGRQVDTSVARLYDRAGTLLGRQVETYAGARCAVRLYRGAVLVMEHGCCLREDAENGRMDGPSVEYRVDGSRLTTSTWVDDACEGQVTHYREDGETVSWTEQWLHGRREGPTTLYHEPPHASVVEQVTPYVNDMREGVDQTFDTRGRLTNRMTYAGGVLDGAAESFWYDGDDTPRREVTYGIVGGLTHGMQTTYRRVAGGPYTRWKAVPFVRGRQHGTALCYAHDGETVTQSEEWRNGEIQDEMI